MTRTNKIEARSSIHIKKTKRTHQRKARDRLPRAASNAQRGQWHSKAQPSYKRARRAASGRQRSASVKYEMQHSANIDRVREIFFFLVLFYFIFLSFCCTLARLDGYHGPYRGQVIGGGVAERAVGPATVVEAADGGAVQQHRRSFAVAQERVDSTDAHESPQRAAGIRPGRHGQFSNLGGCVFHLVRRQRSEGFIWRRRRRRQGHAQDRCFGAHEQHAGIQGAHRVHAVLACALRAHLGHE